MEKRKNRSYNVSKNRRGSKKQMGVDLAQKKLVDCKGLHWGWVKTNR
jgi:hypothetical protein